MQTAAKQPITEQEYLALERHAEIGSEFLDGEMFAMAGGNRRHSRIRVNLISALNKGLSGRTCHVFHSDMRVKIEATGLYTYPDAHVGCGALSFEDEREDTLLNPRVIVEVLSDSTAAWDHGQKFWHYRHLESLHDYVLVSQETRLVEHYTRQSDETWLLHTLEGAKGTLQLESINCRVPLPELYENTGVALAAKPRKPQPPPPTKGPRKP